jgi:hypothetical protein
VKLFEEVRPMPKRTDAARLDETERKAAAELSAMRDRLAAAEAELLVAKAAKEGYDGKWQWSLPPRPPNSEHTNGGGLGGRGGFWRPSDAPKTAKTVEDRQDRHQKCAGDLAALDAEPPSYLGDSDKVRRLRAETFGHGGSA